MISKDGEHKPINLHLDRFQDDKRHRMKYLLEEIEEKKEMHISSFLSHAAVNYGIRRATSLEYLEDWTDGGYIVIDKNIIRFVKKPDYS
jgi:hypothetical protein